MFSAAQYNFKWLKQWHLCHLLGEAVPEMVSFTPESSLKFSLLRKFGLAFHMGQWEGFAFLLLKELVSQKTCCLCCLRATLTSEAEISFCCLSFQFTCRAMGWRCIPFWVTHTFSELSTKGQASGINSSLAWSYTKPLSAFFTLTAV